MGKGRVPNGNEVVKKLRLIIVGWGPRLVLDAVEQYQYDFFLMRNHCDQEIWTSHDKI